MATLTLKNADGTTSSCELTEERIRLGRHPDNTVVFPGEITSLYHAEILRRDGKYILRDLNSSNGTKVNDQFVSEAELHDGDVIFFGDIESAFEDKAIPVISLTQFGPSPEEKIATYLMSLGKGVRKRQAESKSPPFGTAPIEPGQDDGEPANEFQSLASLQDQLAGKFHEIADLDKRIKEKRKGLKHLEKSSAPEEFPKADSDNQEDSDGPAAHAGPAASLLGLWIDCFAWLAKRFGATPQSVVAWCMGVIWPVATLALVITVVVLLRHR